MTSRIIPVQPFDYVVFGATGDLTSRKLIPALYQRFFDGQFDERSRIIGVARTAWDDAKMRDVARKSVLEHTAKLFQDASVIERFVSCFSYVANDITNQDGWAELRAALRDDPEIVRAFYLAVAPSIFAPICEYLSRMDYARADARVVLEKPLGHDLESSVEINDAVARVFSEDQVFRIDHFLGKETVQNLLALRFANALFEPIWNSAHIDHIQITVAESIGAGGR
ncbi:MAG TPA: glucose-6-phosphate dehydrogenase, partial [Devosiaceae bacterium]|nr:glucose-6-phosphate dehydrogenase [Devosiaceae bacterium]